MQAFVTKTRRPKFDLRLKIIDLNNVPLVSGTCYIKWHLPSSKSAEHRGRTSKSSIIEHKVAWEYEKLVPVRLTIDRNGTLQDSEIHFEVLQEYSTGARGERIVLGNVRLNLAEYVDSSDEGEDGVNRRYLMQESKINSTLKIAISMKQTEGDRNFVAPPLKTAPVFGGIAGIISAEQGESDDLGYMPSMSSKTRELGELQDMYRRTLAASWAAQAGELPADECIDNIFAGGDGWRTDQADSLKYSERQTEDSTEDAESEGDRRQNEYGRRSPAFRSHSPMSTRGHLRMGSKDNLHPSTNSVSGRASINQQVQSSSSEKRRSSRRMPEVNDFEAREDLRSWEISATG